MKAVTMLAIACISTASMFIRPAAAEPSIIEGDPELKGVFLIRNEDGSLEYPRFVGSTPAIGADGTIYIVGNDNRFFALHPDGGIKWVIEDINLRYSSIPGIGQDGTIYLTHGDSLSAFSQDGDILWDFPLASRAETAPAIAADGTIIVSVSQGILYAVNQDGTLRWKFHCDEHTNTSPAIGQDGVIYIGGTDFYLYAINPWGTLRWKYRTHSFIDEPVVSGDGTVLFTSQSTLHALTPDGTLKWTLDSVRNESPTISADGTIYIGGSGVLHAVNPDGALKWKNIELGSIYHTTLGADGSIYAVCSENFLAKINPDGIVQWSFRLTLYPEMPVLAPDGTLYITAEVLYSFNTDSGGYDIEAPWPSFMAHNTRCVATPDYESPQLHTISGHVVLPDSTPVDGVTVSIDGLTTESGEDGGFSFMVPDGEYAIDIDTQTYLIPKRLNVTVDGGDAVADVLQAERRTVTGRLMVHGAPLSGAPVYVDDMEALTGADGRFSLQLSDGDHTLEFDREETYFPAMKDITVDGSDMELGDFKVYPIIAKIHSSRNIYYEPFWIGGVPYIIVSEDTICRIGESGLTDVYKFEDNVRYPAIARDNSMVFYGDKLYAVNPDFTFSWEFPVLPYRSSSPIITDTAIYFGTREYVQALTREGTLMWKSDFDTGSTSIAQLALGFDGTLYVACYPGELHAYNPDGTIRWIRSYWEDIANSPVVTPDGTILIGSHDYHLYAVNPDGSLRWKYNTGNFVIGTPFIGRDGTIFVGNYGEELTALTSDGEKIWSRIGLSLAWRDTYDAVNGELWCRSTFDTFGIDPADGSIIWKHPINSSMKISPNGDIYAVYNGAVYAIDTNPEAPLVVETGDTDSKESQDDRPSEFRLHPNHPNPFNPSTVISFTLSEPGDVLLEIYSITGQLVRVLTAGQLTAGDHEQVWDGCDDRGIQAGSGIYIVRLRVAGRTAVRRMTLVR